jgi:polyphosphate kinase
MERNFFRRIEVCFPIQKKPYRDRIIADLDLYLEDNAQAWQLSADGTYLRAGQGTNQGINAQSELLKQLTEPGA